MTTIKKIDLKDKFVRWSNRGATIVMYVDNVTNKCVNGNKALITERVKCDMTNKYISVCTKCYCFTLYIDGENVDNIEIITESEYNSIRENFDNVSNDYEKVIRQIKGY